MVKLITFALSILPLLTVYPHTSSFTAVPKQQRYKQNNKHQQQFSYYTLSATFVNMPSDSKEPKQKKVKTEESAEKKPAAAEKSEEEDVSVDVQRNDDGTYLFCSIFRVYCNCHLLSNV